MSYCPKCGNKVDETMTFCPRCGASLKMAAPTFTPTSSPQPSYQRGEKSEKGEKHEKNQGEKGEKHEKGGFAAIGWLIGGLFVIVIGILAYLNATNYISGPIQSAVTLLIIGVAIIVVAIYLSTTARRRNPAPPV
jgi:zinc-ribbon domain